MQPFISRGPAGRANSRLTWIESLKRYKFIYLLILPAFLSTLVFSYLPMPGVVAAFQDYDIFKGFFKSPWAGHHGLAHFIEIFQTPELWGSVINTLYLSVLTIAVTFPAPIILAILLNELKDGLFKKVVQSISYIPHFLSWISIIGLFSMVYSRYGIINELRVLLFGKDTERILFLSIPEFFIPNILFLSLWQCVGWGSILYLAAMAGIDQNMYESASIDGAGRFKQLIYITIPSIIPTITIMLIFTLGSLFGSNFELVYGLQNPFINFEVISTVLYKQGIQGRNYSMATAIGFAQGLVAFILTFAANKLSKKASGIGIF